MLLILALNASAAADVYKRQAVYWSMLAEIPDKGQAERLVKYADAPDEFGGKYPWPDVYKRQTRRCRILFSALWIT